MTDYILEIVVIGVILFFVMGIFLVNIYECVDELERQIVNIYECVNELERQISKLYGENGTLRRGLLGLWKKIKQKQKKEKKHKKHKHHHHG